MAEDRFSATMKAQAQLHSRLAACMGEIKTVAHDAKFDGGGAKYAYASTDAIYAAVRKILAHHEIGIISSFNIERCDPVFKAYGNSPDPEITAQAFIVLRAKVLMHLSFDGAVAFTEPMEVVAAGKQTLPQGLEALHSYAMKTWLRTTFLLPTGEDVEQGVNGNENASAKSERKPASGTKKEERKHPEHTDAFNLAWRNSKLGKCYRASMGEATAAEADRNHIKAWVANGENGAALDLLCTEGGTKLWRAIQKGAALLFSEHSDICAQLQAVLLRNHEGEV